MTVNSASFFLNHLLLSKFYYLFVDHNNYLQLINIMFSILIRFVLECPHCGVIYRSRQYWYGNQEPEMDAVRTEIRHVWPGVSYSFSRNSHRFILNPSLNVKKHCSVQWMDNTGMCIDAGYSLQWRFTIVNFNLLYEF